MNEIAVVEQLPIIAEKIVKVGEHLTERLENLNLNNLICTEESRKEIKDLRTELGKELKEFEGQRKEIKNQIMAPYEEFNKIYEEEIKNKYQEADLILKNKIDEVESEIKHNTLLKMQEFFDEYKKSKTFIQDEYLEFYELDIKVGLNLLTEKGSLVKKAKDEIKEKVDTIEKEIETISTMQYNDEILVEYLKHKNLPLAIKEVNDRHASLEAIERIQESARETVELGEQTIEKVDEVLQAPIEGQMTIDDFEEKFTDMINEKDEEVVQIKFKAIGKRKDLREIVNLMKERGVNYESITD